MNPVKFKEANKNLLKPENMTDEECSNLWVFTDEKQCISQWKISFKDILKIIFYRKIWLSVLSGNNQPPVWLSTNKTIFEKEN